VYCFAVSAAAAQHSADAAPGSEVPEPTRSLIF